MNNNAAMQGLTSLFKKTQDFIVMKINLSDIEAKDQVRKNFENIEELAADIKAHGLLQPIIVYENEDKHGKYTIISGERRYRATQRLQLPTIEAIVRPRPASQQELVFLQIAENLQRENLDMFELANQFKLLQEEGLNQSQIAEGINKPLSFVSRYLALTNLPFCIERLGKAKKINPEALVNLKNAHKIDADSIEELAKSLIEDENNSITVEESRAILKKIKNKKEESEKPVAKDLKTANTDADLEPIQEEDLSDTDIEAGIKAYNFGPNDYDDDIVDTQKETEEAQATNEENVNFIKVDKENLIINVTFLNDNLDIWEFGELMLDRRSHLEGHFWISTKGIDSKKEYIEIPRAHIKLMSSKDKNERI